MARAPGDLGGDTDRERARRDVPRDVRVRGDDRLGADAAAGVDHRAETDLRTILQHDRGEAVLEALEQGVAHVVRDDQRAHRQEDLPADEHRPAHVDERLVPDEGEIADREHRPRVAMTAASEPDRPARPDSRAEERAPAENLQIRAELARFSDCDDLLAPDRRPRADLDTVLDDDLRRRYQRALAEDDARADLGAVLPQDRDLLVGRQEAERIRVRAETLEEAGVECACALIQIERGGQAHVLGRETGERGPASGEAVAFWRAISSSTSFSVMKPRFSIAARSTPWRSASSAALRVALRSVGEGFGAVFFLLGVLLERRQLLRVLGDARDRLSELDLDAFLEELDDRPGAGASISTVAFVVSTTHTGCPCCTSARSSTSHSARSANSVFASSRVRTISSISGGGGGGGF